MLLTQSLSGCDPYHHGTTLGIHGYHVWLVLVMAACSWIFFFVCNIPSFISCDNTYIVLFNIPKNTRM